MEKSFFIDFLGSTLSRAVQAISERFNDSKDAPTFLHKTMLTEEASPDMSWGSATFRHRIVAADIVALDSRIPLKQRPSFRTATGEIPKLAVSFFQGERFRYDVLALQQQGVAASIIAKKLLEDAARAIRSIEVRKEIMFLSALSTGACLIKDASEAGSGNSGVGIRADFGYLDENKFTAKVAGWDKPNATPKDDLDRLFAKAEADGNAIAHVYLSRVYFNHFRNSKQGKILAATFSRQVVTDPDNIAPATTSGFLEILRDEYNATFHVISGNYREEMPDGSAKTVQAWEVGNVVATTTEKVGRLVYSSISEENAPLPNVTYAKSGTHILVSKFSEPNPIREYTQAQALCIPVIDDVDAIYLLDASKKA